MRRFLLIAAAASIALVGLSANQCGGGEDKGSEAAPPAESTPPAEAPADSNTDPNNPTVDEIPADE